MNLSNPAYDVLGESAGRVLGRLAVLPDGASGRRIHELSGVATLRTTQRLLDQFVRIGLVDMHAIGKAHRYTLNREHLLWKPVEILLELPAAIESELIEVIESEFDGAVDHAILYGSFARGTADDSSDIDVLIQWRDDAGSPDDLAQIVERAVSRVRERTGNSAHFLGVNRAELQRLIAAGDPLVDSLRREGRALAEGTDIADLLRSDR